MKREHFSDSQIVKILKADAKGVTISVLKAKYGISVYMLRKLKKKYRGMNLNELRRFKKMSLEKENLQETAAQLKYEKLKKDFLSRFDI
jgi:hypothetical protein